MTARHRNSRRAFTLLELLAAVAIIGVLAALLAPALGRMRNAARDAGCRSNLRQLHAGFAGYITDNGKFPRRFAQKDDYGNLTPESDRDPVTGADAWYENLWRYVSAGKNFRNAAFTADANWPSEAQVLGNKDLLGVFICPADARKHTGITDAGHYRSAVKNTAMNMPSYTWNNRLDAWRTGGGNRAARPAEVSRNCIILIDGRDQAVNPTAESGSSDGMIDNMRHRHGAPDDYDIEAENNGNHPKLGGGHANAVMFDGAVRSFKEGKIPWVGTSIDGLDGRDVWMPWD
jgi:prepilin-type N-terminal cleavage/methylation domain-containing protein